MRLALVSPEPSDCILRTTLSRAIQKHGRFIKVSLSMTYHTSEQLNTTRTAEKEETHQDKKAAKEAEMEAVEAEHQRRKGKGKDGVELVGGTLGSTTHQ